MTNKKELSETDIREIYINHALEKVGWDMQKQIRSVLEEAFNYRENLDF